MSEKKSPDLSGLLHAGSAIRETRPSDKAGGKFAEIGGIEIKPPQSFETQEKPIDFSHPSIAGKRVGQHLGSEKLKGDDNV